MRHSLHNMQPPPPASEESRQRVARYIAQMPPERLEGLKRSPPTPLAWYDLHRFAERAEGIVSRPLLRCSHVTFVPLEPHAC